MSAAILEFESSFAGRMGPNSPRPRVLPPTAPLSVRTPPGGRFFGDSANALQFHRPDLRQWTPPSSHSPRDYMRKRSGVYCSARSTRSIPPLADWQEITRDAWLKQPHVWEYKTRRPADLAKFVAGPWARTSSADVARAPTYRYGLQYDDSPAPFNDQGSYKDTAGLWGYRNGQGVKPPGGQTHHIFAHRCLPPARACSRRWLFGGGGGTDACLVVRLNVA